MAEETGGADIDVKVAGQEVSVKNVKSLNTIVTLLTFVLVSVGAYVLYQHQQDGRDATRDFVTAIKEQTQAIRDGAKLQREQNCLMALPQDRRDPELCRRLSQ